MKHFFIFIAFYLSYINALSLRRLFYKGTVAENVERAVPIKTNNNDVKKIQPYKNSDKFVYAQNFLQYHGYELNVESDQKVEESQLGLPIAKQGMQLNTIFQEALKLFQKMHNLTMTGQLDEKTENLMKRPRCGMPDLPINRTFVKFKAISKWNKNNLTWKLNQSSKKFKRDEIRATLKRSLDLWASVTPLKFTELTCSDCKADLIIDFGTYDHGDEEPFDGPGGVLAHAAFPSDGRVHFDDDESFSISSKSGVNLNLISAHEFGHALGLDHSRVDGSLMDPYYENVEEFKLGEDDILGIQSLYGVPITIPTTTTTTTTIKRTFNFLTTTRSTTTRNYFESNKNPCLLRFNAVFMNPLDPSIVNVIVNYNQLWSYDLRKRSWFEKNLYKELPQIEAGVRCGVVTDDLFTWFFKGRVVWIYYKNVLLPGFPRIIYDPLFPNNPYTAFYANNTIFLLKANFIYRFDTQSLKIVSWPEDVKGLLPGFPHGIQASINFNGIFYLFRDDLVFEYDIENKRVINNYPRLKHDSWFACTSPKGQTQHEKGVSKNKEEKLNYQHKHQHEDRHKHKG